MQRYEIIIKKKDNYYISLDFNPFFIIFASMTEKKDNSHNTWANGKKASMKRRLEGNNYLERGIYMITIATEGRRPLFGQVAGNPDIVEGPEAPHVDLTPLGEKVREEWYGIPRYYPQIEVIHLCVMPDHIHGILFVHERIERHLGHVINGFKAGTRKAARALGVIAEAKPLPTQPNPNATTSTFQKVPYAEAQPQPNPQLQLQPQPQPQPHPHPEAQPQPNPHPQPSPKHPPVGTLWEPGYNDRVLLKKGQLKRMLAYVDDNPRRLLLKRQHPQFFSHLGTITVAGIAMQAMGNAALLQCPQKLQVQCSRHLYPFEIDHLQMQFLEAGRKGAVIVSPCISPGEQQIATACMAEGIPLIVLLLKGFPPFFKPQPRYLKACAEGRLLMLSPYPWQNETIKDMRSRCLHLNKLAAHICKENTESLFTSP